MTAPGPSPANAESPAKTYPFQRELPDVSVLLKGSAMRYANWSPAKCRQQLARNEFNIARHRGASKGIATPLRITGELAGVRFRAPPKSSSFGLLDCRLLFALRDFAKILREHQVAEVRIDNFYRNSARLPGRKQKSQHAYGLAADVVSFTLDGGLVLNVEDDWQGAIGTTSCGPKAELRDPTAPAIQLRNLVCDLARRGIFHHILTPNYNAAHRNHLHLDIKRDNKWFSLD